MSLFFNVKCMSGLEANTFGKHKADFVYMIGFGIVGTILASCLVPHYFIIGISLEYMLLYYWARRNPFFKVSMYFIPFKSTYIPFALLLVSFATSAEYCLGLFPMYRIPWSGLVGVILGHIYYFLRDVVPVVCRKRRKPVPHYTEAPVWLYIFSSFMDCRQNLCNRLEKPHVA